MGCSASSEIDNGSSVIEMESSSYDSDEKAKESTVSFDVSQSLLSSELEVKEITSLETALDLAMIQRPPSPMMRRKAKGHEDEVELIIKSKRANVYTPGVTLENRINYKPKNILKTKEQDQLIRKYLLFFLHVFHEIHVFIQHLFVIFLYFLGT